MKYQRGVTLSGLLVWCFILFFVALLGMKVVPTVMEYYKIVKNIKTVAGNAAPEATVSDIRKSFDKYADVDYLEFKSNQLDISKEDGKVVIEFAYEKRIPLFANVSLVIDYAGSSAK